MVLYVALHGSLTCPRTCRNGRAVGLTGILAPAIYKTRTIAKSFQETLSNLCQHSNMVSTRLAAIHLSLLMNCQSRKVAVKILGNTVGEASHEHGKGCCGDPGALRLHPVAGKAASFPGGPANDPASIRARQSGTTRRPRDRSHGRRANCQGRSGVRWRGADDARGSPDRHGACGGSRRT